MVEHIEAEIDQKDLGRDHHAVQDARHDAGLEVPLKGLAVGHPPVARLVPQGAEDGVVHSGQGRAGQNAAHGCTEEHDRQAVHQKAEVDHADHRQKADAGQDVGEEQAAHVAADQLKKAARAGLAGCILFDARASLKIVRRRK